MAVDERWGDETADLLRATAEQAIDFLSGLPDRPVTAQATLGELRRALAGELPEHGEAADSVVSQLVANGQPGVIGIPGPRFFGFVIGGSLPAALAADWLTSTWDQNAGIYAAGPAAAVVEEVAAAWLLDLFDLPRESSVGFTTGCQMAHVTALAAARRSVLLRHGWDVEQRGLAGAPQIRVLAGDEVHVTIPIALQMLGLGSSNVERVPVDEQGRMRPDALRELLVGGDADAPTIVCVQVGNVNTGACDPVDEIADIVREREGAWLHVDGAFGLWARVSPKLRHLARGVERADSWASDSHKWLNVPYDSGLVIVRDTAAHRAAMMLMAAYLIPAGGDERDPSNFVPEFSRRARGFAVYAALRSLGRSGVTELVERCSGLARRMADRLAAEPRVEVLNEVVLNQVLVRFGNDDALTADVVRRVQEDGTCWLSGSRWQGRGVMRISVSNWSTTDADADVSVEAILRCWRETQSASAPA
ncbi:MAG TPA: aminotransferase class V-fold PLP-dependent enzyme, partial [Candidatus Caenarcaniphilales bacterium]|nr:aminotransferase class V-fold PLP-dependent enzyme [Candidatus Caenarcaniphilales bacterium]